MNIPNAHKLYFRLTPKKLIYLILAAVLLNIILYWILINNPIVTYVCDKDIAGTIISKESVVTYGENIYRSSILKPIFICVSDFTINDASSLSYGQIEISYIPIIGGFGAKTMEYSIHDAPYIKPYYNH